MRREPFGIGGHGAYKLDAIAPYVDFDMSARSIGMAI